MLPAELGLHGFGRTVFGGIKGTSLWCFKDVGLQALLRIQRVSAIVVSAAWGFRAFGLRAFRLGF